MTATAALRVGTRASRLAIAQSEIAVRALAATSRVGAAELVPLTTRGDAISARRPHGRWVETDGQFTRELEQALLERHVDVVVHSFKDLPTEPVDGLAIGAVLERADARDCLLEANGGGMDDLPFGGRIATSSPRRAAQLAAARSDLIAVPIRGNVESRLRRLEAGEFDGLVLAAAGLDRLGVAVPRSARLSFDLMLPAPAQGALALQCRADDDALLDVLAAADHRPTRLAVEAERALLRAVGGGCLAPLGTLGEISGNKIRLRAAFETDSGALVRAEASGAADRSSAVVDAVARRIADQVAPT